MNLKTITIEEHARRSCAGFLPAVRFVEVGKGAEGYYVSMLNAEGLGPFVGFHERQADAITDALAIIRAKVPLAEFRFSDASRERDQAFPMAR